MRPGYVRRRNGKTGNAAVCKTVDCGGELGKSDDGSFSFVAC